MKKPPIWSRLIETAVCQLQHGWLLIPITIALTIAILRIGLVASCLLVAVLGVVFWARKYRVTVRPKGDE